MNKEILKESMIIALILLLGLVAIVGITAALIYFLPFWGFVIVGFIALFVAITYSVYQDISSRNNKDGEK